MSNSAPLSTQAERDQQEHTVITLFAPEDPICTCGHGKSFHYQRIQHNCKVRKCRCQFYSAVEVSHG